MDSAGAGNAAERPIVALPPCGRFIGEFTVGELHQVWIPYNANEPDIFQSTYLKNCPSRVLTGAFVSFQSVQLGRCEGSISRCLVCNAITLPTTASRRRIGGISS